MGLQAPAPLVSGLAIQIEIGIDGRSVMLAVRVSRNRLELYLPHSVEWSA